MKISRKMVITFLTASIILAITLTYFITAKIFDEIGIRLWFVMPYVVFLIVTLLMYLRNAYLHHFVTLLFGGLIVSTLGIIAIYGELVRPTAWRIALVLIPFYQFVGMGITVIISFWIGKKIIRKNQAKL